MGVIGVSIGKSNILPVFALILEPGRRFSVISINLHVISRLRFANNKDEYPPRIGQMALFQIF